ncbi:hypothetical protein VTN49DRAFT_5153 [Thermomyces lanuginosus]|uniref:uncharacterized protein n=1 Tax=Thermomyces lanuginosus TaxID=5541 RepID=UPI0037449EF0
MWLYSIILEYVAPLLLITSPITSYADQIYSIHRTGSSTGFSLDIPLIMLVASIFKVFYWFGAYYSASLLLQAVNMILVQLLLLKVALANRPAPGVKEGIEHVPFSGQGADSGPLRFRRPYDFWQWRSEKPYWLFLCYMTATLFAIHVFLPIISRTEAYINLLGTAGLTVEALLPLPQIITNQRARSCRGFRLSVIVAWLLGDAMKIYYLFSTKDVVPLGFKMCATFQSVCDAYLGVQYWMFELLPRRPVRSAERGAEKDIRLT